MMAEYSVSHPALQGLVLTVKPSVWTSPKLLKDGVPLKKAKGKYVIEHAGGDPVIVQLKLNWLDLSVPKVFVNGEEVAIAPPLSTAQKIVVAIPILLLFIGGALGGALGAVAAMQNATIMRSDKSPATKYGLVAACILGAVIAYVVLGSLLTLALGLDTPQE